MRLTNLPTESSALPRPSDAPRPAPRIVLVPQGVVVPGPDPELLARVTCQRRS